MRPIRPPFGAARSAGIGALLLAAIAGAMGQTPAPEVDLLIRGGRLIDGTGDPWMQADLAVRGDRIVAIGRGLDGPAGRTIDATGLVVAPGFIDMHAHSEFGLLVDGRGLSKAMQGVTTDVLGEHLSGGPIEGLAEGDPMLVAPPITRDWTSLGGFFARLERQGLGINVLSYVGSGQVRAVVMGYGNRPATPAELEAMKTLVEQAMTEGAFGLSSGLNYIPNVFASTAELTELARVAGRYGGIYVSHLRGGLDGLKEGLQIARDAHVPLEIHHINSTSSSRVKEFVASIEEARRTGLDVTANAYPYVAGWTYMRALLPHWAQEGGTAEMLRRLRDPAARRRIIGELRLGNATQTFVSSYNEAVDGLSLAELGARSKVSAEEAVVDLILEQNGDGFQISFGNTEPNLMEALRQPWVSIGSDGSALAIGMRTALGKPHPRSFGTHPRVLAKYVRQEHLFTLEEAVRKMTGLPSARVGLSDRGLLRVGMKADIVLFEEAKVSDRATFEEPEQYATGIPYVLVNGVLVVDGGKPTDRKPGVVLRGPGFGR